MSLILWCGAKANSIKEVVGPTVAAASVPHLIVADTSKIPAAEPGDVILGFGTKVLETLLASGLVPKNRTINSLRGTPITVGGAKILLTFDPGIVQRDYSKLPEIQWDIKLASRLVKTGSMDPVFGDYRYVESLHDAISFVEAKYAETGRAVPVSCDLECVGLDEYAQGVYIVSIAFTYQDGKSDLVYFQSGERPVKPAGSDKSLWTYYEWLWVQINWLLTSPKIALRGANFKFDCRWIRHKWGIACTNFKFDTMLVGSLLDENRSNGLKLHAKIYTDLGGYDDEMNKYDKGRMDLIPKEVILPYAGGDTDVTHKVADHMRGELLRDRALSNFYVNLLHPSSIVFEQMERNGVLVDLPYYHRLKKELEDEISRLENEMVLLLPYKMQYKYAADIKESFANGKNPMKAKILCEFLFTPMGLNLKPQVFTAKTNAPSTSLDHLMMFEGDPVAKQFIGLFREHTSASKTLSTYVVGFLAHLRSDGRFHPTFLLGRQDYGGDDSGTVTGRSSAKDPAIQTVPKHTKWSKKLRRAFICPEGYTMLQLDYSQGELRIAADVAHEPTMIKAYQNGMDLHAITAAQLNGYSMEEFLQIPEDVRDELRSSGKAGNFGLIYGMQHKGFREYAYTSYGVEMTEQEAFIKRTAFFDLYSRLLDWHDEAKAMAHRYEVIRSPLGRIRHLPLINSSDREMVAKQERQAINSPIQATLSDMMQLSMVEIHRQYQHKDLHMCMMTHDSVSAYVPIDKVTEYAKGCKEIMENLPLREKFGWDHTLKFIADAEASVADSDGVRSFASLAKLKNL